MRNSSQLRMCFQFVGGLAFYATLFLGGWFILGPLLLGAFRLFQ